MELSVWFWCGYVSLLVCENKRLIRVRQSADVKLHIGELSPNWEVSYCCLFIIERLLVSVSHYVTPENRTLKIRI